MAIIFRICTEDDLHALVKISKETFVAAFEKDNDPDDFKAYIQKAFDPQKLASELSDEDTYFYFLEEEGVLLGYFKLNIGRAQTDVHDMDSMEIERIYVLESHQGKRIGTLMLQEIINLAKRLDKSYIWLGVWEHNPKAIRFYQRNHFQKFGEHPYYIGNDKQTDWLLRLDLH
ncbi:MULTISPECIES: GNAT family N-acetyltransferase [Flagellimonas]|uniref:GNAT family N-acetyltransferase n=1 Tax=Flagellimonas hadalis TaxID=2597517 RepID=A0A5N5J314_9FLAO|nr:GNAT family N-acetyltransferase [Allomuricauda hadalis]KAB5488779.1 GNAT family N-acetyltransferase [Allomuricauda hadalis]